MINIHNPQYSCVLYRNYLNIQNVFVIFNQTPNSGVVGLSQKPACSDRLCCQYYEEAEPPYHRSRVDSEYSCTLITLSKIILTIMCRYMMYWQLKKKLRNLSPSDKSAVCRSNQVGMKTPIPFFMTGELQTCSYLSRYIM